MDILLEIARYTLPAFIVFLTAFYAIRSFIDNEQKKHRFETVSNNQRIITPIRLQAYERIILLLERISPESLIMRISEPKMTVKQLQTAMLNTIRSEYEHNLSQQLYVSAKAWEIVKNAKSNTVKFINTVADGVDDNLPSLKLSEAILKSLMNLEKTATNVAIDFLKQELNEII